MKFSRRVQMSLRVGFTFYYSMAAMAVANPSGGNVAAGGARFDAAGGALKITTATDRTIINWNSFSIGSGQSTNFVQPNAGSAVLNRVIGSMPSEIAGQLVSNGRVGLLNQNGILITRSGSVNTNGFTASTLNLSDDSFMGSGALTFKGQSEAVVSNSGAILARQGDVFLLGRTVNNSGSIEARDGNVALAAGSEITLQKAGDGRMTVSIPATSKKGSVNHSGTIKAVQQTLRDNGGNPYVLGMKVDSGAEMSPQDFKNAQVAINAGKGKAQVSGTITAGTRAKGGEVTVQADEVEVTSTARVDVSGDFGGGSIKIGGGFQGKDITMTNARTNWVQTGATLTADARVAGNGGSVIVWSDISTAFGGAISAKGGALSGDGGFAEVSGKQWLGLGGLADLTAANGSTGTLLLDPTDIILNGAGVDAAPTFGSFSGGNPRAFNGGNNDSSVISIGSGAGDANPTLLKQLTTANVVINTTSTGSGTGNITVSDVISYNSANSLTLSAGNLIAINQAVTNTGTGNIILTGAGGITLGANVATGGNLQLTTTNSPINQTAGILSVTGTTTAAAGTGTITLNGASNDFTGAVTLLSTGASVQIRDLNALTLAAPTLGANTGITAIAGTTLTLPAMAFSTGTGNIDFRSNGGTLATPGTLTTSSGSVTLLGSAGLTVAHDITTTSGSVSLTGGGVAVNAGRTVNAGNATILVTGNDGAISLTGALTTTNNTATAVRIIDATTAALGNITTGATGTVVLGEAGGDNLSGAVTQTGIIDAGTLIGQTGSTVKLTNNNNTLTNLGAFSSIGTFELTDLGGLAFTGSLVTNGGAAISTNGLLALNGNTITANGNVSLNGIGVTSFLASTVDAGSGTILVDGNDGAVNLAGALTTTNNTAAAVRIIDATTAALGNITTGATGTVVLGQATGNNLSGAVTQTGIISAGTLIGNTGSTVTLTNNNTLTNLGAFTSSGAFALKDNDGLIITGDVTAASVTTWSGGGGVGNTTFGVGVNINADIQSYRAGNGLGNTAEVNLTTNNPAFRNTAGSTRPTSFTYRQDASMTDGKIVASASFGGTIPSTYVIQSDGGSITLTTANKVTGSALTLAAGTDLTINSALSLASLSASAGIGKTIALKDDVTTTGTQTFNGGVQSNTNITLKGTTITFNNKLSVVDDNTVGKLTINGNLAFGPGSNLFVTLEPKAGVDKFDIITVTGGVNLAAGATLSGVVKTGSFNVGNGSKIVAASGSVTGAFTPSSNVTITGQNFDIAYANSVGVTLTRGATDWTWTGIASINWDDDLNWVATGTTNTGIPGSGDIINFNNVSLFGSTLNNDIPILPGGTLLSPSKIIFGGPAAFTLNGNGLLLTNNLTISNNSTATQTVNLAIDGGFKLTLNGSNVANDIVLGRAVGAVSSLTSITSAATTAVAINGGSVKTTGDQTYNGKVTTSGATTLNVGTGSISAINPNNDFSDLIATDLTLIASGTSVSVRDVDTLSLAAPTLGTNTGITAIAGSSLTLPAFNFSTGTGNIDFRSNGGALATAGKLTTTSGSVTLVGSTGLTVAHDITTTLGPVSLAGGGVVGVSVNAGIMVDAGNSTILVDGNDAPINLGGALTTTNGTATAVRIIDSTTASLGNITTGATGTVVLGEAVGDNLSGAVTQTDIINAGTLIGNTGSTVKLINNNTLMNLGAFSSAGAFELIDLGGLSLIGNLVTNGGPAKITTTGLLSLSADINTGVGDLELGGIGVDQTSGKILTSAATINGGTGTISLNSSTNNFTGAVTLKASGAFVSIRDENDLILAAPGLSSTTSITAIAGATLTLPTLYDFTAGTRNINLQSNGGTLVTTGSLTTTGGGTVTLIGSTGLTVAHNITNDAGSISLIGTGVAVNTGITVNAGSSTILVDANDGAMVLNGALTTTNNTATAIRLIDGSTALLGNITTGTTGSLVLGEVGGDSISGAVTKTPTGVISAGTLIGQTGSTVTLAGNNTLTNLGAFTSNGAFTLNDVTGGLNVTGAVSTTNNGIASITTTGGNLAVTTGSVAGAGVTLATTGLNDIALGGNVNGNAGIVTLTSGRAISQSVGVMNTTGTLTGSAATTVSLNLLNTIANLGAFTSNGAFTLNDTTGGLNVTGAVSTTNNGLASLTTTGGNLAVTTGSVAGAGVTLVTTGLNDIALGGNVNGNAGTVTLTSGRAISQSAGVVNTTGALTGSAATTVSLNQLNTIANLGAFTSNGSFLLNDLGGLALTGSLATNGGLATITTTGLLALNGNNITTANGAVSLTGIGVTSLLASTVNAGSGTILVDANDGAISLAGALTTINNTATAVRIIDATTAALGNITTGASGTVVLGQAGGDNLSGPVTQTGIINAGTVIGNTGSTVTLAGNNTLANLGAFTSNGAFTLNDVADGLNVTGTVSTSNNGIASITTTGGNLAVTTGSVAGAGVTLVTTGANDIALGGDVNGNAGTVTLTSGRAISQSAGVVNTTGTLTGSAATTVSLNQLNTIANLGAFTNNGAFTLNDTTGGLNVTGAVSTTNNGLASITTTGGNLAVTTGSVAGAGVTLVTTGLNDIALGGNVDGNAGTVTLTSGRAISQSAGVVNTTGTLTGSAATTVSLNRLNTIADLGAFTSNGAFTLNDTTGGLNVTGAVSTTNNGLASITTTGGNLAVTTGSVAGAGVTLVTTGANDIALGGDVNGNAGTVTLTSGQAISQSAGVVNTTGTLTGSAATTVSLNQLNTIANLAAFTSNGAFTLNDTTGGLNVTGAVSTTNNGLASITTTGGNLAVTTGSVAGAGVTLVTTGLNDIALGGNVNGNAGTVTLTSGRAISQSAGVVNTTGTLTGSAATTVSLNRLNTIADLGAFTSNGAFTLNDTTGGLNVTGAVSTTNNGLASITTTGGNLAVTTGSVAGAGVTLVTTGLNDIALGGNVDGNAGTVTLTSGQAISQSAGVINTIEIGTLTGTAATTVSLNQLNTIANLGAFTSNGAFTLNDTTGGLNVTGAVSTTNNGPASITTTGGNLAVTTGSVAGAGVTLVTTGLNDIALGGNVDGNAGTVTLTSGQAISQSAGVLNTTGTLTGSAATTVSLNQLNTIANLGAFTSNGAFLLNDLLGLALTGNLVMGDNFTISTTGAVTDAPAISIDVTKDSSIIAKGGKITLNDTASDVLSVGGNAFFSGTAISLGSPGAANFGSLTFTSGGAVTIQEDSGTLLAGTNTANSLDLTSSGAIKDNSGMSLTVTNSSAMVARSAITLNDTATDVMSIGDNAFFSGTVITLGYKGAANFGSLTFTSGGGVTIQEDSDTLLVGNNTAKRLVLTSSGAITEETTASLKVIKLAKFGAVDDIVLTNENNDLNRLTVSAAKNVAIRDNGNTNQAEQGLIVEGSNNFTGTAFVVATEGGMRFDRAGVEGAIIRGPKNTTSSVVLIAGTVGGASGFNESTGNLPDDIPDPDLDIANTNTYLIANSLQSSSGPKGSNLSPFQSGRDPFKKLIFNYQFESGGVDGEPGGVDGIFADAINGDGFGDSLGALYLDGVDGDAAGILGSAPIIDLAMADAAELARSFFRKGVTGVEVSASEVQSSVDRGVVDKADGAFDYYGPYWTIGYDYELYLRERAKAEGSPFPLYYYYDASGKLVYVLSK